MASPPQLKLISESKPLCTSSHTEDHSDHADVRSLCTRGWIVGQLQKRKK